MLQSIEQLQSYEISSLEKLTKICMRTWRVFVETVIYINAINNPGTEGFLLARCLTGLGLNGTGNGANGALGGWYFNGTMIPNSDETVECTSPSVGMIQARPGGRTAGVINIRSMWSILHY